MNKCLICPHKEKCEKEYGRIDIDNEDCTSICGTHFCLWSWSNDFQKRE
jgi:hypothetical protein